MTLVIPDNMHKIQQKHRAKITHSQRCAVLALRYKFNVSADALATLFDVSLVTIYSICSPKTKAYSAVFEDLRQHGLDTLYVRHVTQDMLDKLSEHINSIGTDNLVTVVIAHDMPHKASKRRDGEHLIKEHRFIIQWLEAGQREPDAKEGWYFMVPDKFPDQWLGGDKGAPFTTSTECYAFCKDIAEYW